MTPSEIEVRLKSAFPNSDVAVVDLTGTMDHFEVKIATVAFKGLSRIQQHQSVMKILQKELESGEVHALVLKTLAKESAQ